MPKLFGLQMRILLSLLVTILNKARMKKPFFELKTMMMMHVADAVQSHHNSLGHSDFL